MKNNIILSIVVLALCVCGINAQTKCKQTTDQIAKDVSAAFKEKNLGRLDTKRGRMGKVKLKLENANAGDDEPDKFVFKTFANLKALEKWLIEDLGRIVNSFKCRKSSCIFEGEAQLHNHLYLKKITFGFTRNKCPYIKSIYIIDGN